MMPVNPQPVEEIVGSPESIPKTTLSNSRRPSSVVRRSSQGSVPCISTSGSFSARTARPRKSSGTGSPLRPSSPLSPISATTSKIISVPIPEPLLPSRPKSRASISSVESTNNSPVLESFSGYNFPIGNSGESGLGNTNMSRRLSRRSSLATNTIIGAASEANSVETHRPRRPSMAEGLAVRIAECLVPQGGASAMNSLMTPPKIPRRRSSASQSHEAIAAKLLIKTTLLDKTQQQAASNPIEKTSESSKSAPLKLVKDCSTSVKREHSRDRSGSAPPKYYNELAAPSFQEPFRNSRAMSTPSVDVAQKNPTSSDLASASDAKSCLNSSNRTPRPSILDVIKLGGKHEHSPRASSPLSGHLRRRTQHGVPGVGSGDWSELAIGNDMRLRKNSQLKFRPSFIKTKHKRVPSLPVVSFTHEMTGMREAVYQRLNFQQSNPASRSGNFTHRFGLVSAPLSNDQVPDMYSFPPRGLQKMTSFSSFSSILNGKSENRSARNSRKNSEVINRISLHNVGLADDEFEFSRVAYEYDEQNISEESRYAWMLRKSRIAKLSGWHSEEIRSISIVWIDWLEEYIKENKKAKLPKIFHRLKCWWNEVQKIALDDDQDTVVASNFDLQSNFSEELNEILLPSPHNLSHSRRSSLISNSLEPLFPEGSAFEFPDAAKTPGFGKEKVWKYLLKTKRACDKEFRRTVDTLSEYMERALNPNAVSEEESIQEMYSREEETVKWDQETISDLQSISKNVALMKSKNLQDEIQEIRRVSTPVSSSGRASVASIKSRREGNGSDDTGRSLTPRARKMLEHEVEEFPNLPSPPTPIRMTMEREASAPARIRQSVPRHVRSLSSTTTADYFSSSAGTASTNNSPQPSASVLGTHAMRRIASVPAPVALAGEDKYRPTAFVKSLVDLISLVQHLCDSSINDVIRICSKAISKLQRLSHKWQEHPEWPLGEWPLRILLIVAALSRAIEIWREESATEEVFKRSEATSTKNRSEKTRKMTSNNAQPPPVPSQNPERKKDKGRAHTSSKRTPGKTRKRRPSQVFTVTDGRTRSSSTGSRKLKSTTKEGIIQLRAKAEEAQSQNILLELTLGDGIVQYVSPSWKTVIGSPPEEIIGNEISSYLINADASVFRVATASLLGDDSQTLEVHFHVMCDDSATNVLETTGGEAFREMVGKGMLMYDRELGEPSHTLWLIRPAIQPENNMNDDNEFNTTESEGRIDDHTDADESDIMCGTISDGQNSIAIKPSPLKWQGKIKNIPPPITLPQQNLDPVLCRICEEYVSPLFFEKHSGFCAEVHRAEMEVQLANDMLRELKKQVKGFYNQREKETKRKEEESSRESSCSTTMLRRDSVESVTSVASSSSHLSSSVASTAQISEQKAQVGKQRKVWNRLFGLLKDEKRHNNQSLTPHQESPDTLQPTERTLLAPPKSAGRILRGHSRSTSMRLDTDQIHYELTMERERQRREAEENLRRREESIFNQILEILELAYRLPTPEMDSWPPLPPISAKDPRQTISTKELLDWHAPQAVDPVIDRITQDVQRFIHAKAIAVDKMIASLVNFDKARQDFDDRMKVEWEYSKQLNEKLTEATIIPPNIKGVPIPPRSNPQRLLTVSSVPSVQIDSPPVSPRRRKPAALLMTTNRVPDMEMIKSPIGSPALMKFWNCSQSAIPSSSPTGTQTGAPRASPSIKDYEILKPISKGAFGSVYLAKKRATGDYYAIKVLRKSDMIAKNQVTNVKAERMILMMQNSSFVVNLYYSFQSKDYLYLVMEYLNGGDCASLIKSIGCLDEDWTRGYLAEVVLGLEYLHNKGVIHRDLKPDNLLIDQDGHLKLTDFGLSRLGFLGRRARNEAYPLDTHSRAPSIVFNSQDNNSLPNTPDYISQAFQPPLYNILLGHGRRTSFGSNYEGECGYYTNDAPVSTPGTPNSVGTQNEDINKKCVGTPDYLAPESILGSVGNHSVDWWALGVICYEFLYGIPPFHDETPEKVFENILRRKVSWHEEEIEISVEARDLMERLLCINPEKRLGSNGAEEVKRHPFFKSINWEKVREEQPSFVPQVEAEDDTAYFDSRGVLMGEFDEANDEERAKSMTLSLNNSRLATDAKSWTKAEISDAEQADFGNFTFKNLEVLEKANEDVIRKLKTENLIETHPTKATPALPPMSPLRHRPRTSSLCDVSEPIIAATTNTPLVSSPLASSRQAKPSNVTNVVAPLGSPGDLRGQSTRLRNTISGRSLARIRTSSTGNDLSRQGLKTNEVNSASVKEGPWSCLIADDNPVACKILETMLSKLNCNCIVARNGAEAIRIAMGDVKFDIIFMDIVMPIVDGESASRMIKSTRNKNQNTPIVAVTSYDYPMQLTRIFDEILSKPVDRMALQQRLRFFCQLRPNGVQ